MFFLMMVLVSGDGDCMINYGGGSDYGDGSSGGGGFCCCFL